MTTSARAKLNENKKANPTKTKNVFLDIILFFIFLNKYAIIVS